MTTALACKFLRKCILRWLEHSGRHAFCCGRLSRKRRLTALRTSRLQGAQIDRSIWRTNLKKDFALGVENMFKNSNIHIWNFPTFYSQDLARGERCWQIFFMGVQILSSVTATFLQGHFWIKLNGPWFFLRFVYFFACHLISRFWICWGWEFDIYLSLDLDVLTEHQLSAQFRPDEII